MPVTEGSPTPLGATWIESEQAYNFALYSKDATTVSLLVYGADDFTNPLRTFPFEFPAHKTSRIWHFQVSASEIAEAKYYAFKVDGPFGPGMGLRFDRGKVLLDPYAREVFLPPEFSRAAACAPGPNDGKAPLALLPVKAAEHPTRRLGRPPRHTHDLVIYELHVRNFTNHPNSPLDSQTRGNSYLRYKVRARSVVVLVRK